MQVSFVGKKTQYELIQIICTTIYSSHIYACLFEPTLAYTVSKASCTHAYMLMLSYHQDSQLWKNLLQILQHVWPHPGACNFSHTYKTTIIVKNFCLSQYLLSSKWTSYRTKSTILTGQYRWHIYPSNIIC